MKWTAVIAAVVLAATLAGSPAFPQAFDDRAIRPGEGIGPFRLGGTVDQVREILGRPADGESAEAGLKVYRWTLEGGSHTGLGPVATLSVGVGADGAVVLISTTSTAFATPGGNGVGMTLNSFKQEFGGAYRGYKDNGGVRHLRFDIAGLAVTYDIRGPGQTTVRSLAVFPKASAMPEPAPAILPGVGVGPVRIGMSLDEASRAMGRGPDRSRRGSAVWVLSERDPFGEPAWLTIFLDDRGAIAMILTDAVAHRTAQGSGPGVDILELQAEFGPAFTSNPLVIPGETSFMGIWYDQQKVAGLYHPGDSRKRILLLVVYK